MPACPECDAAVPAGARFCPTCAASLAQAEPSEERKLATVLFADLVGSTELAGSQDPERTRLVLDRFYDAMAGEIDQAGGTVEKFVGDAVMAVFGVPVALEDHAERALHAALAMQRRLQELFADRLALRVGVNTGEVVVGRAREGSSFVTGDAVNVCARLEQAAAPGEILVGERTAAAVRGAFELEEALTVEAKGKPGGVQARRLVRALSLMRPRGVGGLRSAFVGRERELDQLRSLYERAVVDGEARLVTILGDAGVGKSRLVRELWGWLAEREPQPLQRTGRCLSYGHGTTYWPLAEVLREQFAILDSDPSDIAAARLGSRRYLGLTLGLETGEELHPLAVRERMHDAWVEFLGELVRERPAVVLIEDVHWAEDDLLDLLEMLVEQVSGPLLVLATARPELLDRRPRWVGERDRTANVLLEALAPADAGELLGQLLGADPPPLVREIVVDRSEGNPFFVEELVATLIDRGLLSRRNSGWSCSELPEGFAVPDTVQAVLAARIDLLPAAEKAALQAASVIGRVFWTRPVYELLGGDAPDFGLLEERDFVRRRAGSTIAGEREYAIKHALTREVAYGSLPKARRAQLHASFAVWLERSAEGNDDHAPLLAHHYAEAVRPEDLDLAWAGRNEEATRLRARAVDWSRRAAKLALGRYEIDEGLALLHRAVELEPDPVEQAELWYEIGHANALKYDSEAFTAAMEQAIELGGPSADVYTELCFQTVQRQGMWWKRPTKGLVDGWIEQALKLTEEGTGQRARALFARASWRNDEEAAHESLALATRLGDVELRSLALSALFFAAYGAADYDRASPLLEEQLALLPQIADPDHRANVYFGGAWMYVGAGRIDDARQAVALLEETAEGLTPHHRLHGAANRVLVESSCGCWEDVRRLTPHTEQTVEANLATPCRKNVSSLLYCALAHAHGDDNAASRRLEAKADAIGMEGYGWEFDAPKIQLAIARDDLAEVRRLIESMDANQLAPRGWSPRSTLFDAYAALGDRERIEADAPEWLQRGGYVEPFALRALGAAREDEPLLSKAASRFQAIGLDWHAGETRKLLSATRDR